MGKSGPDQLRAGSADRDCLQAFHADGAPGKPKRIRDIDYLPVEDTLPKIVKHAL